MEHTSTYLELVLKYQWFDMIQEDVKLEEYRDITPFWIKRIFSYSGVKLTEDRAVFYAYHTPVLISHIALHILEPRHESVRFQRGYTYNPPRLIKNIEYIRIGIGKPEWGAQEGKEYIVIGLNNKSHHILDQPITHTIIDIPSGLIAHCETYEAAIHFREIIGRGDIISPAAPIYVTAIREARATWEKGGDHVRV